MSELQVLYNVGGGLKRVLFVRTLILMISIMFEHIELSVDVLVNLLGPYHDVLCTLGSINYSFQNLLETEETPSRSLMVVVQYQMYT